MFQSYTISRENSFSPDTEDFEMFPSHRTKLKDDPDVSDDSGTGRSTGLSRPGSLSSSAPRTEEAAAREMLRQATRNCRVKSAAGSRPLSRDPGAAQPPAPGSGVEVVEVQTVGVLRPPAFQLSSTLLQATPLGQVPGHAPEAAPALDPAPESALRGHPGLGSIPGRSISSLKIPDTVRRAGSDFDETEPLEPLTMTRGRGLDTEDTQSLARRPLSYGASANSLTALWSNGDLDETEPVGSLTFTGTRGHPGLGSMGEPAGLGSVGAGGHPGLGCIGGRPSLGTVPGVMTSASHNYDVASWCSGSQDTADFSFDEDFQLTAGGPGQDRGEKSKFTDSGVISGDYSAGEPEPRAGPTTLDIDALSDGGLADMGTYPGIRLAEHGARLASDPLSVELESALKHLNPAEVERRRQLMGRNYRLAHIFCELKYFWVYFITRKNISVMTLGPKDSTPPEPSRVARNISGTCRTGWRARGRGPGSGPAPSQTPSTRAGTPASSASGRGASGCRTSSESSNLLRCVPNCILVKYFSCLI